MICPVCHRCPFDRGVCEDRVNRGRRFFLMGALALPVARKLEALAPIVAAGPLVIPIEQYVASYQAKRWNITTYANPATLTWMAQWTESGV